jgi:hypothetical protein
VPALLGAGVLVVAQENGVDTAPSERETHRRHE